MSFLFQIYLLDSIGKPYWPEEIRGLAVTEVLYGSSGERLLMKQEPEILASDWLRRNAKMY